MKFYFSAFILLFFFTSCVYERHSLNLGNYNFEALRKKECDSLVCELKKARRVEGKHIGITHVRSYVYEKAEALWELSSVEELVHLCRNKNAVLRCYAFLGLVSCKNEKKIAETIAQKHKKDKTRIVTFNNCLEIPWTVYEYMENQLRAYYPEDYIHPKRTGKSKNSP